MDSKNWQEYNRALEDAVIADNLPLEKMSLKQLDNALAVIYKHKLLRPRIVDEFVWAIGETASMHAEYFDLKECKLINKRPVVRAVLHNHGYAEDMTPEKTSARFRLANLDHNRCLEIGNYRLFKYIFKYKSLEKNESYTNCAAQYGHFDMLKEMVSDGFAVSPSIGYYALRSGSVKVLKYAESLGFKLDTGCWEIVLESENAEIVKYLIERLDSLGESEWDSNRGWKCAIWDDMDECDNCALGNYYGLSKIAGAEIISKIYEHRAKLKPNFDIFYVCAAGHANRPLLSFLLEKKIPVPNDALRHCLNFDIIRKLHSLGASLEYVKVFQVCDVVTAREDPDPIMTYLEKNGINMRWHYYDCIEHGNYKQASVILKYHRPNTYTFFCDAWDAWKRRQLLTDCALLLAVDMIEHEPAVFSQYFTKEMAFACVIYNRYQTMARFWNRWNYDIIVEMLVEHSMYTQLKQFATQYNISRQTICTAMAKYPNRSAVSFQNVMGYSTTILQAIQHTN